MSILDLLQWPATVVTVAAAWCVASLSAARRQWGFWLFLVSNVLWTVWLRRSANSGRVYWVKRVRTGYTIVRGTGRTVDCQEGQAGNGETGDWREYVP